MPPPQESSISPPKLSPPRTATARVDWWKEGVSTYWAPEAAARFHSTPAEETPEPQGKPFELKVIALPRNSFFVLCPSPEGNGEKVAVRLLRNKTGPKLMGKTIRAELRDGQFHQVP